MSGRPDAALRRILLVEDHPSIARLLRMLLESEGYQVQTADTCGAALAAARDAAFDVIVSDLMLPDGNACECLQPLLQCPRTRGIALSGLSGSEQVLRSRAAGFAEHLVKPVDPDELIAAIRRVLGAR